MSNDRANISRRAMLKWMAMSTAGLTLAACAPAAAPAGTAATEASVAASELDILVCCYTTPEVALREQFNTMFMDSHSGSKLNMELLAGGQNYFEKLLSIGVINPSYVVYKCPECHMWHVGLKEWSE